VKAVREIVEYSSVDVDDRPFTAAPDDTASVDYGLGG
jgi:hypothetical protein